MHGNSIGVLRGGKGALPPPPLPPLKLVKLEVADQQGVVNSRSQTKKYGKPAKTFL